MTDYEFALLQKEIQETMDYLARLQKEYIRQTGKRYVPDGRQPWVQFEKETDNV